MEVTIGGNRLGSGKKMKADIHGYARSTHNLSSKWKNTQSAGTLVPFMCLVAQTGDSWKIKLSADALTHPTVGPLFGSFKFQLDVFQGPIRLYQGQLHNNKKGIGMKMSTIKLPQVRLKTEGYNATIPNSLTQTAQQIHPSCIFAYLGIRGLGRPLNTTYTTLTREFNAVPFLIYWDTYGNYYANQQEQIGAVIHTEKVAITKTVTKVEIVTYPFNPADPIVTTTVPTSGNANIGQNDQSDIVITFTGTWNQPEYIILNTTKGEINVGEYWTDWRFNSATQIQGVTVRRDQLQGGRIMNWRYATTSDPTGDNTGVQITTFPLENLDTMRENILAATKVTTPFIITDTTPLIPYTLPMKTTTGGVSMAQNQEGLAIKTYQSDINNNWMLTEWIESPTGISAITSVDTTDGAFTIDTLNLATKVYAMLNRIALSGGTYDDWLETVYDTNIYKRCSNPIYLGGLSKELVFQQVIANSASEGEPLGQLAGRGIMSSKHKGGYIDVTIDEPSYIMGIISITPRIDYSQGNRWDVNLKTMDDFHKPALDQIGYQDLVTDTICYWDSVPAAAGVGFNSAGKQPAWLRYMTDIDEVYGNFAIEDNEMFMILNRRYEQDITTGEIADLTTYIDPMKFNYIFAETSLSAQNFWVQVDKDITVRRKMSAKIIPNL